MKYNCDSCVFDTEDIQEAIEHEQTYEGHWTILQHNFFGDPD